MERRNHGNIPQRDYSDIIDLPHHVSKTHPRMSQNDRAAQFSPFAALTGYEDVIKETSRLTKNRKGVSVDKADELSKKLQILDNLISLHPFVRILYFKKDAKKSGGAYLSTEGEVRRINEYDRRIEFLSGVFVPIDDIFDLEGDIFEESLD